MKRLSQIIRLLRQAITGHEHDYTQGSIRNAIILLSIPMVLEMIMESLFAVVDAFFVARISTQAVTTVGLTESMLTIIYSLGVGISTAATATVARRVGEKKFAEAGIVGQQAVYLSLALSLLISAAGIFFAEDILRMMGASQAVLDIGTGYTRLMLGGNVTIMMLFLNNGILRGAGNASAAMRVLILSNLLNIALCPLLIFGWGPIPGFGLLGAAMATTIGRGTAVLYQFWLLSRRDKPVHLRITIPDWDIMGKLTALASGAAGQYLITAASWIILVRIISHFGDAAVAGYTIGIRIIVFAIMPAFGMANAAATLVGQNLGAEQPERAEKSVWLAAYYNMALLGLVTLLFYVFARPLVGYFTREPISQAFAIDCLQIVCLGYIFYAMGMVVVQSFNGAGDTRTPTLINLAGFWAFQVPLAYLLAIQFNFGPRGVFAAIAIAESVMAVAAVILFRRGKWKTKKV